MGLGNQPHFAYQDTSVESSEIRLNGLVQIRLLLVILCLLLAGCSETEYQAPKKSKLPKNIPGISKAVYSKNTVKAVLAELKIYPKRPYVPGYDRSCSTGRSCVFGEPWSDSTSAKLGRNGCDTRDDVLRTALTEMKLRFDNPCRPFSGNFVDPYSGASFPFRGNWLDIQIDHVVPLSTAWHLGASEWTQDRRDAFANDPTVELVATTKAMNQQKFSAGPDKWLPPKVAYRCSYITRYLKVLRHWQLGLTSSEANAINRVAKNHCPAN